MTSNQQQTIEGIGMTKELLETGFDLADVF